MPAEFKNIDKYCGHCGTKLVLTCTRDVDRKKYCSRVCNAKETKITEKGRQSISIKLKGRIKSEKEIKNISRGNKGKIISEEVKQKMSKTVSDKIINGEFNPFKGSTKGWYNCRLGNFFYRSSYELDFIKKCEKDISILTLIGEPFHILMENNRRYIPDFLLNESVVIEIKPKRLLAFNKYKIEQGNKYCNKNNLIYKIITEKEIYE
jgi:hypothetical protein